MPELDFENILRAELTAVSERRRKLQIDDQPPDAALDSLEKVRQYALMKGLVGLAFSGGGIRSGTLAVGFLQGLAKLKLLRLFDYLSTVSGGGYAGAWLAGWLMREGSSAQAGADPVANVEKQLNPSRQTQGEAGRQFAPPVNEKKVVDQEPEPLHHLREYTRYLTPKAGMFSADTWTLLAGALRNMVINLVAIVAMAMVLIFASRWIVWGFAQPGFSNSSNTYWTWLWSVVTLLLAFFAIGLNARYRSRVAWTALDGTQFIESSESRRWIFITGIVLPLIFVAVGICWTLGNDTGYPVGKSLPRFYPNWFDHLSMLLRYLILFGIFALPFAVVAFGVRTYYGYPWDVRGRLMVAELLALLAMGVLLALSLRYLIRPLADLAGPAGVVTLGPPIVLTVFMLSELVAEMFTGRWLWDYELEWYGKVHGYLFMAALFWLVLFSVTLYLPHAIVYLAKYHDSIKPVAIAGWILTTIGGILVGNRPKEPGTLNRLFTLIRLVAPTVFIIGFLALLSVLVGAILDESLLAHLVPAASLKQGCWIGLGIVVSVIVLIALNCTIGANHFSWHKLYGNRLVRCYLGASRRKQMNSERPSFPCGAPTGENDTARRSNPVTGFDPNDDFRLVKLRAEDGYPGPYPLFNTSLELVAGDQLAWQDRKAASFTLSPDYCGCEGTGWARTPSDEKTDLTVGTAMTLSGAAVDPNMAAYQSAALTVFLTIFNARTGMWFRNPRFTDGEQWVQSLKPWFGLPIGLMLELLGQTNEKSSHLRLADGGHFENLGVYELIRRRCRFIVACDFAEDHSDASENLAQLIRLVRVDFGIRIEIDTSALREDAQGLTRRHVATGTIHYEDVDEEALAGTLVFVRSSLTGDESPDIRQYAEQNSDFPHQSTADQFFDANQFEAYRALGEHIASAVFEVALSGFDWRSLFHRDPVLYQRNVRRFFARLRSEWYPQPENFRDKYNDTGGSFSTLLSDLRKDGQLTQLTQRLYPELPAEVKRQAQEGNGGQFQSFAQLQANLASEKIPTMMGINQIINIMETAWLELNLDTSFLYPINRGWLNAFRRWTAAPDFQRYWPVLRGEYSPGFIRFCERQLNAPIVAAQPIPYRPGDADHQDWLKQLNAEFLIEWCEHCKCWDKLQPNNQVQSGGLDQPYKDIPLAFRDSIPNMRWVIALPYGDQQLYPIGVLTVYQRTDTKYEVLMWIRGAYRFLGLGRSLVESRIPPSQVQIPENADIPVHDWIEQEFFTNHAGPVTLVVRYPASAISGGERLQETMWANFFYDYDFHRRRPPHDPLDTSEDRHFVVLERKIRE